MKTFASAAARRAFTLIEMLVVMSIIVVLAGLTLSATGVIKKKARISRTRAELARLETAIENYKQSQGFYPPDNPRSTGAASLFYELCGTIITNNGAACKMLQGSEVIGTNQIYKYFGRAGFANSSRDAAEVKNFLPVLKQSGYKEGFVGADVILLSVPVEAPYPLSAAYLEPREPRPYADYQANQSVLWQPEMNSWNYVSKNPTNRPGEFDLWADIKVGSKFFRVSNWAEPVELHFPEVPPP